MNQTESYAPEIVGLGRRVECNRARGNFRPQGGEGNMRTGIGKYEVAVDFVRDDIEVVAKGKVGKCLQFVATETPARGDYAD